MLSVDWFVGAWHRSSAGSRDIDLCCQEEIGKAVMLFWEVSNKPISVVAREILFKMALAWQRSVPLG